MYKTHTHILLYISFMIFFLFGMILIKTHTHTLIFIQVISSKDHFICFFHMEFGVVFGNIGIKSCPIMGFEFIFFLAQHNSTVIKRIFNAMFHYRTLVYILFYRWADFDEYCQSLFLHQVIFKLIEINLKNKNIHFFKSKCNISSKNNNKLKRFL